MTRSKNNPEERPTDQNDQVNKEQDKNAPPNSTPQLEGTPLPGTSNQPPPPPALPVTGEKQASDKAEETETEDKKKKGGWKKTSATAPKTPTVQSQLIALLSRMDEQAELTEELYHMIKPVSQRTPNRRIESSRLASCQSPYHGSRHGRK